MIRSGIAGQDSHLPQYRHITYTVIGYHHILVAPNPQNRHLGLYIRQGGKVAVLHGHCVGHALGAALSVWPLGAGNAVALAHIISRLAQEYRVNVFFPLRFRELIPGGHIHTVNDLTGQSAVTPVRIACSKAWFVQAAPLPSPAGSTGVPASP